LALRSGSVVTTQYKPDQDTAPFMEPWAMIDEVEGIVTATGRIAYRGHR